jgi:hypothetical protein
MKIPCLSTFRYTQLASNYGHFLKIIDNKLEKALTLCLATDIWTNRTMADFIGVVAIIINECFQ